MEKIAEGEALKHEIGEARRQIELDMKDPAQSTADAAGEVGMVAEMWNVMKKHGATARELTWKDVKAMGMGALSVIPIVGEAGTAVNIGKAVTAGKNVAKVEKATWMGKLPASILTKKESGRVALKASRGELWKKFGKSLLGITENPVNRYLAYPLQSSWEAGKASVDFAKKAVKANSSAELKAMRIARGLAAEKAIEAGKNVGMVAAHSILHRLDPFLDVPAPLTLIAGLAEFVLPGANIAPAIWQLAHNKIEWTKMYGGLALDMGKVVMKRFEGKMTQVKKPDVVQAAAVFA